MVCVHSSHAETHDIIQFTIHEIYFLNEKYSRGKVRTVYLIHVHSLLRVSNVSHLHTYRREESRNVR